LTGLRPGATLLPCRSSGGPCACSAATGGRGSRIRKARGRSTSSAACRATTRTTTQPCRGAPAAAGDQR
jgi:hypothetical protein